MKQFNMDENESYSTIQPVVGNSNKKTSNTKVLLIAILIAFLVALLLGTASACVVFALKISQLESEMVSLQMVSTNTSMIPGPPGQTGQGMHKSIMIKVHAWVGKQLHVKHVGTRNYFCRPRTQAH
jgi:hypothetical protein